MIYLKVKGTFQQITEVLQKHFPFNAEVRTFANEAQTYYLTVNEPKEIIAKLITDLVLAKVTMMGALKETEIKKLFHRL